jgi:hypothetical protein
MLLTMEQAYKESYQAMPNPERIDKVTNFCLSTFIWLLFVQRILFLLLPSHKFFQFEMFSKENGQESFPIRPDKKHCRLVLS